jgi:TPR repeat protein
MKTNNKRILIIGACVVGLLFLMYFLLYAWLCLMYPSEFAPDFVIKWQNQARVSYYRSLAERGNAEAQRELGTQYFLGIGGPMDRAEAVKWFHKAIEHGDVEAHCCLAYCYFNGEGVPEDKAEAVKHYRLAAELGNVEGQWKLGAYYLNGIVVPKDEEEAVKWFRKAADQGYFYAIYLLGRCYFEGTGVPKDDTEAAKLFRKIQWMDKADDLLKEIESGNPRAPNSQWGPEVFSVNPTPFVKSLAIKTTE